MLDKMLQAFHAMHPLNEAMMERLQEIAQVKEYPKKTILLREGQTSDHAWFVLKGLARAYYISDGKEITSRFMDEGFIITSWLSFYTRKPGDEFIETLEDSTLASLHHQDIEKMYRDMLEFNVIGRKLTEFFFFLSEQRTQMLRKHTAEEKYNFFMNQHPDLLQRVPLKYVATYLGMNEETLSRVRSRVARQKPKN